ncbi:MFS transporter [Tsukamurella sp. 8F]|uniref:MFS transporter n=1 Tax=unclassified Tsukamurella TaxID=2633480 RepID=UPI0023B9E64C|nr:MULTISPECIES: MFS transporter [unclassified Tsukamurella]MDF0528653.1 MFS transporter [Tsukamurella sp. 8J]MDF0585615.1 MFS transporter [Tsukamurella sp. 8F]
MDDSQPITQSTPTENAPHDGAVSIRYAYLIAATGLVAGTYGMCRFGFGLTLPRIGETLGISSSFAGSAAAAAFATYSVSALATGALVQRGRLTAAALLAAATAVVGCLLVAFSSGSTVLLFGIAVAGAAAGFVSPTIAAGMRKIAPPPVEPRWQAIANAGTGFGVLLAGILAAWVSWRASWVTYGILTGICAIAVIILRRAIGARDETNAASAHHSTTDREQRGKATALAAPVTLAILMGAGSAVFWTFGRTQAEHSAHLPPTASLVFWCAVGGAGILGALSGDSVTKIGFRRTWSLASSLLALSIAATTVTTQLIGYLAIGLVFGATYVILCGAQITAAAIAWPNAVGAGTAITFTAIAIGQISGSLVLGKIIDTLGTTTAFLTGAGLCAASAALIYATGFGRTGTSPLPATRELGEAEASIAGQSVRNDRS